MRLISLKKKIILIDSHVDFLKNIAKEVAGRDTRYDILATDNISDALEALEDELPLVIMISFERDFEPGHLNAFFKKLKSSKKFSKIPLIFKSSDEKLKDQLDAVNGLSYSRVDPQTSTQGFIEKMEFYIYKNSNHGGVFKIFNQGQDIFKQGDSLEEIYVLYSGEVMAYQEKEGDVFQMGLVKSPEIVGEVGIFQEGLTRTYSAKCMTTCEVMVVKKNKFQEYMTAQPLWVEMFISQLVQRLRKAESIAKNK
ncbi:MAG: Crp/Fnr family transcriptional regulator [Oligoflexia bacterium]|nr:Crp/Fnr family transcriptional regulator [Oligoflexia bacterium]